MSSKVDLYDTAYGKYELDLYREIRIETYGEDLGQTSWVTTRESNEIPTMLEVVTGSRLLEIGSGSGRYAIRIAETLRCQLLGLDINPHAIANANGLAHATNVDALVRFEQCDASKKIPAENDAFDAAFANDVLCHLPDRREVLAEMFRVLKPGGRLLFSDALLIAGTISNEEVANRSLIGHYVFSPPGENQALISAAGFELLSVADTSESAAEIAMRWRDARNRRMHDLIAIEGENNFAGLQRFLSCVYTLTSERRLLRHLYLARKNA